MGRGLGPWSKVLTFKIAPAKCYQNDGCISMNDVFESESFFLYVTQRVQIFTDKKDYECSVSVPTGNLLSTLLTCMTCSENTAQ
jgi:hypothetical protein